MEQFERKLFSEIKKWIERKEIIAIKGPRQSGKTTLLKMIMQWLMEEKNVPRETILFLTFEDREKLEQFSTAPKEFISRYRADNQKRYYFLLDEAQYCQEIGQKLKLLYDLYDNVKFIITGSSSLELVNHTGKYLVGRMFSFELLPLSFEEMIEARDKQLAILYRNQKKEIDEFLFHGTMFETKKKDILIKNLSHYLEEYIIFGSYPEVIKAINEEEKAIILTNIFNTYLEKDILAFLHITDIVRFRKLVSLLSFIIAGLVSYEKITRECQTYYKEMMHLLDILEQTYIIQRLPPFHQNLVTELRKNPKIFFYDLGLRNYAVHNFNKMNMREDAGKLAENFVFMQFYRSFGTALSFWRTTAKAEVDLVIRTANDRIPVEVKFERMEKPAITKSFHSFLHTYQPKQALIVTKDFWAMKTIGKTQVLFAPIVYL